MNGEPTPIACPHCEQEISLKEVLTQLRPDGYLRAFWVEFKDGTRTVIHEHKFNPMTMKIVDGPK